jgi:hypothetical protein
MRSGSHHMVSWVPPAAPAEEGWAPLSDQSTINGTPVDIVQSPTADRPSTLDIAPENQGIGMSFPVKAPLVIQLHHINASPSPILREVWINIWWLPAGSMVQPAQTQPMVAPIDYPPNDVMDNTQIVTATGDTRIVSVFGHRHAWTPRFSTLLTRADGTSQDLYESFSWQSMPTFQFDSLTKNPAPRPDVGGDGAASGDIVLHAGDRVSYTCHVDTTAAAAAKLGVPVPQHNLTFGNEVFGAEMCLLYLVTTGAPLTQQAPPQGQ